MIDYDKYLQSAAWRVKSREAKDRAGWHCALCPTTYPLEVHHRTYARVGSEDPDDLVVLCEHCHRRHHDTLAKGEALYRRYQQATLPFTARVPEGGDLN